MLSTGSFTSFDASIQNWNRFASRLSQFLIANRVRKDCEVATVLTLLGEKTFDVLCDLIAPELPETKTVDEIFSVLSGHFSPKPLIRKERIRFQDVKQNKQESIADYVLSLRNASLNCRFGTSLESRLGDQFVYGLADEAVRRRLLLEEMDIPFEKLVQLAKTMESSSKETTKSVFPSDSLPGKDGVEVLAVTSQELVKTCFRCGSRFHDAKGCRFAKATCYNCNKVGHIAKVCKAKKSTTGKQTKFCKVLSTSNVNSSDQALYEDLMRVNISRGSIGLDRKKAECLSPAVNVKSCAVMKRIKGMIRWFNPELGYGFITRLDNQKDIFIHASNFPKLQLANLARIIRRKVVCKFDVINSRKGLKAINCSVLNNSSNIKKEKLVGKEVDIANFQFSSLHSASQQWVTDDVTFSHIGKDERARVNSGDLCPPYFEQLSMFP